MDSYETTEARVQQKERAYQKMDIMVATPGRMVDMLDRRATNLRRATYFVREQFRTAFSCQVTEGEGVSG